MTRWTMLLGLVVGMASCAGTRPAETRGERSASAGGDSTSAHGAERTVPAPLRPLRPSGAEAVLDPLAASPTDPAAHAAAARFYALTDVAGMTLLWGVSHAALGGDDPAVAEAMLAVLRERVSVHQEGTERTVSTQLAPGAVPVLMDGRTSRAPVAHLFELRVTMPLAFTDGPPFVLADLIALVRGMSVGTGPGSRGLDAHVELFGWLAALDAAGHLDAFATQIFARLFPEAAAASAPSLAALQAFVAAHPFRPTHAVMPDDLVDFP